VSRYTRRRVVTGAVALVAGIAGCAEDGGSAAESGGTADTTATATDTPTTASDSSALDLREANVVAVEIDRPDDGYRFDVTLHHDDDGEEGYANWWQVETVDGERLGRRDLLHAHGTREFTRSATVSVPDGTACVVVRGHDQTHGYGGQAMVVNVKTGAPRVVRQGVDRQSVAGDEC